LFLHGLNGCLNMLQCYIIRLLVTDFGVKVKQFVNKGHLVPDKLMISLITSELHLLENNNWLLDGE